MSGRCLSARWTLPSASVPKRRATPAPSSWTRKAAPSPPLSRGGLPGRLAPALGVNGVGLEDALRRIDPLEDAIADGDRAARFDDTLVSSPREILFEVVALLIAVEELGDWGVAPVDDPEAMVETSGTAQAQVTRPIALTEPHVCEVGGFRVYLGCGPRFSQLRQQRTLVVPARV